jgi:hypothetical protein
MPFVKVVHGRTRGEYDGCNWVRNVHSDPDFASTTKQKAQKIDSVFITFNPDEVSKTICVQPDIEKF